MDKITGKVLKIIYQKNNFIIFSFLNSDNEEIVCKGYYQDIKEGFNYHLEGEYFQDIRYGLQFNFKLVEVNLKGGKDDVLKLLTCSIFKGISLKTANKIIDFLGLDCLEKIMKEPSLIDSLKLKEKYKQSLKDGISKLEDSTYQIKYELLANGFDNNEANYLNLKYKEQINNIININPFLFYIEGNNIRFDHMVVFARNYDFDNFELKYNEALLINIVRKESFKTGDMYMQLEDLENAYFKASTFDFLSALKYAIDNNHIVIIDNKYYLYNMLQDEMFISDYIKANNYTYDLDLNKLNILINYFMTYKDISLSLFQKEAIVNSFTNKINIITGGPGTGKTTIIEAIIYINKLLNPTKNNVIVAPTGRASKRISELTGFEAKTIHSLLKWEKESNSFMMNKDNPITYQYIIIDEFSMVDNELFASLLKASPYVENIVIIGDVNQLPAIKQGNLLYDLICSNIINTTKLKDIFRQKQGNEIINLAKDIVEGKYIYFNDYQNDIVFIDNCDIKLFQNNINALTKTYQQQDIQVLAPMYKGVLGITNLNKICQEIFNHGNDKNSYTKSNILYKENDRVIQLVNRVNDDIYNGDIGYIQEIDLENKTVITDFMDNYCMHEYSELDELMHAYCISIHKAQGCEFNVVVLILNTNQPLLTNARLIYTAITRAKNKLYIYCDELLFNKILKNNIKRRKTSLINFLNAI